MQYLKDLAFNKELAFSVFKAFLSKKACLSPTGRGWIYRYKIINSWSWMLLLLLINYSFLLSRPTQAKAMCFLCANHTTMHQFTVSFHAKPIGREHMCLTVTCHLHFRQNDQNLLVLCATAGTQRWKGTKTSHHRKLTLQNKILPPFLPGLESTTFQ